MTKIEMPTGGVRDGKTFGILEGDVAWPNIVAIDLPVRTLKKVKKTEKKWAQVLYSSVGFGQQYKILQDGIFYEKVHFWGKIGEPRGEGYMFVRKDGTKECGYIHALEKVWVEEDTVVEVEEWV